MFYSVKAREDMFEQEIQQHRDAFKVSHEQTSFNHISARQHERKRRSQNAELARDFEVITDAEVQNLRVMSQSGILQSFVSKMFEPLNDSAELPDESLS